MPDGIHLGNMTTTTYSDPNVDTSKSVLLTKSNQGKSNGLRNINKTVGFRYSSGVKSISLNIVFGINAHHKEVGKYQSSKKFTLPNSKMGS